MASIDDAVRTEAPRFRSRLRGGLVTVGTVAALLAAMGLTVLGLGAADNAVANYDASSWLWSAARSELARVNGVTARVDTRTEIPAARQHPMQVTQTDRLLILRDLQTGQVSSLDLATLQLSATTRTTPGLGVSVALHEDAAFVVDAVQGIVRQLDPRSLTPVGEPVRYPPGITGGTFDGKGRLWIAVPSQGTVSAITAAKLPSAPASAAAGAGLSPQRVDSYDVADASHELVRLHPGRRGGGARPDGRQAGAGAARRGPPDGADAVRPGGAARAHQRPPGAGHRDRRPAGAAGG